MKLASCPSCGEVVEFSTTWIKEKTCPHCHKNFSKEVAETSEEEQEGRVHVRLLEDMSPFRLGTRGRLEGQHFTLVGRVKMHWEDGSWDEWWMHFDDGKTAWLAHAEGAYILLKEEDLEEKVTPYMLKIGKALPFLENMVVKDIKKATRSLCEGRLPPDVKEGQEVRCFDLQKEEENKYATIEFVQQKRASLFVGSILEFDRFHFTNLREFNDWPLRK